MVSKFKIGYLIGQFVGFILIFFLLLVFFSLSFKNGEIDYLNAFFWVACFGLLNYLIVLLTFLFSDLKQFTVTKDGIDIKYLITRKKYHIKYSEILRFKGARRKIYDEVENNLGYLELEIHLADDNIVVISGQQFRNYNELKECIFMHRNNAL